jgi:hypothetical protein
MLGQVLLNSTMKQPVAILNRILQSPELLRQPIVIVLDEVDHLLWVNSKRKSQDESVLSLLVHFLCDNEMLKNWNLVCISNNTMFLQLLKSPDLLSRLTGMHVEFPCYTAEQFVGILQHQHRKLEKKCQQKVTIDADLLVFARHCMRTLSGDARQTLAKYTTLFHASCVSEKHNIMDQQLFDSFYRRDFACPQQRFVHHCKTYEKLFFQTVHAMKQVLGDHHLISTDHVYERWSLRTAIRISKFEFEEMLVRFEESGMLCLNTDTPLLTVVTFPFDFSLLKGYL